MLTLKRMIACYMLKGTNLVHYSLPQHHGCIARTRQSMIDEEVDGLAAHKTVAVFDEAIPSILDFDTISKSSSDCLKIQRMTCGRYFGHLAILFMELLAASWTSSSSASASASALLMTFGRFTKWREQFCVLKYRRYKDL